MAAPATRQRRQYTKLFSGAACRRRMDLPRRDRAPSHLSLAPRFSACERRCSLFMLATVARCRQNATRHHTCGGGEPAHTCVRVFAGPPGPLLTLALVITLWGGVLLFLNVPTKLTQRRGVPTRFDRGKPIPTHAHTHTARYLSHTLTRSHTHKKRKQQQ